MTKYNELREKHQKEVNEFPIGFAFSDQQFEEQMKKLGYNGCRNCKHQIDILRTCEWLESGGDGVLHLICPKWEKREVDK